MRMSPSGAVRFLAIPYRLLLLLLLLCGLALAASEYPPPDDPFGLGRRSALIVYLQEHGLPQAGTLDDESLWRRYQEVRTALDGRRGLLSGGSGTAASASSQAAVWSSQQLAAEVLRIRLRREFGQVAPKDATVADLEALLAHAQRRSRATATSSEPATARKPAAVLPAAPRPAATRAAVAGSAAEPEASPSARTSSWNSCAWPESPRNLQVWAQVTDGDDPLLVHLALCRIDAYRLGNLSLPGCEIALTNLLSREPARRSQLVSLAREDEIAACMLGHMLHHGRHDYQRLLDERELEPAYWFRQAAALGCSPALWALHSQPGQAPVRKQLERICLAQGHVPALRSRLTIEGFPRGRGGFGGFGDPPGRRARLEDAESRRSARMFLALLARRPTPAAEAALRRHLGAIRKWFPFNPDEERFGDRYMMAQAADMLGEVELACSLRLRLMAEGFWLVSPSALDRLAPAKGRDWSGDQERLFLFWAERAAARGIDRAMESLVTYRASAWAVAQVDAESQYQWLMRMTGGAPVRQKTLVEIARDLEARLPVQRRADLRRDASTWMPLPGDAPAKVPDDLWGPAMPDLAEWDPGCDFSLRPPEISP